MRGRQRFECLECGLITSGRIDPKTGLIYPYDRAGSYSDDAPLPSVCVSCLRQRNKEIAEVGTRG